MQCLGFAVKLCQFGFHLQCCVILLQVDIQRLRFGNLHLIPVLEKRERKADYHAIERYSRFRIPSVPQLQLRQPLGLIDSNLFAGNQTFVAESHQRAVCGHHFGFQNLIVGRKRHRRVLVFLENHRDISVQRVQLLQFIAKCRFVQRRFLLDVQQSQINLVRLERVRIPCLQTFGIHLRKLFRIAKTFFQYIFLLTEHNNIQTKFFRQ